MDTEVEFVQQQQVKSSTPEIDFTNIELWPLDESIKLSRKCVDLLVDNRYMDAIEIAEKYSNCSIYHSHCNSLLLFFKAYLSLEQPEVKKAELASEKTMKFCEIIRQRTYRDNFFVKLFFDLDYIHFNDDELHAELIRAEQTIFASLLEFFVDQSIFVLMKVSYRLRSAYMTYKQFSKMMELKEWNSDCSANTFFTGVKLGLAIYNLMFSMVPERLMGILSMVGFKGSKYEGLALLKEASDSGDLRSFVAQMFLSMFECYLDQMWNVRTVHTPNTENYIKQGLSTNSLSIWYSIFKGRISLVQHNVEQALKDFEGCVLLKNLDIKQLTTLYHWELLWTCSLLGNWPKAIHYGKELRQMCVWSQSTLCYLEASFRIMWLEQQLIDETNGKIFEKSKDYQEQLEKIDELLKEVPKRVKRYAGRRIPMEKFACEKVIKYEQEGRLLCPTYEMIITWNHLIFIEGQENYLLQIIDHVDKCLKKFQPKIGDESYLLLILIKASCLRLLNRFDEAKNFLMELIKYKKNIKHDRHLYPFACLELGIVLMLGFEQFDECQQYLLEARNTIKKDDPMELFVQFRVGKALRMMRKMKNLESSSDSSTSSNSNGSSTESSNSSNGTDGNGNYNQPEPEAEFVDAKESTQM